MTLAHMSIPRTTAVTSAIALALVASVATSCHDDASEASTTTISTSTSGAATAPTAEAGATGEQVHIVMERPPNRMAAPTCEGEACVYSFASSPIQVTGDLVGVATEVGAGAPLPGGGYGGVGYVVFSGTAPVCGGGIATVAWTDRLTQLPDGSSEGTWAIIEGSGTGALAHATGQGSGRSDLTHVAADGSGRVEGAGTVDCG